MYRSELTTITDYGINIDQDLMKSIGVRPGSQCWGMLVDGRRNADNPPSPHVNIKEPGYDPASQSPHLMVSPVHHNLWPSSARVAVMISDKPGALASLLRVISKRANIQLYELAPIGYKHSEIRMIINFPKFSTWSQRKIEELQEDIYVLYGDSSKLYGMNIKREEVFKKIGALMNALLSALVAEILLNDVSNLPENPILSPRFMQLSTSPWFTNYKEITRTRDLLDELFGECEIDEHSEAARKKASEIFFRLDEALSRKCDPPYNTVGNDPWFARTCGSGAVKNNESESEYLSKHIHWRERFFARTWRDSWTSTIRTSPLSHLAYAKVWGYKNKAIPLVYQIGDSGISQLGGVDQNGVPIGIAPLLANIQDANDHVHDGVGNTARPNPPEYAHSVVDSDGLWLRLRFLQQNFAHDYGVCVKVAFEATTNSKDAAELHTQGVLASICTAIADHGGDIRMAYNEIKPSVTVTKRIVITLFCVIGSENRSHLKSQGLDFRECLKVDWKRFIYSTVKDHASKIDATLAHLDVDISEWNKGQ